ncbi:unnamed protein product [Gordionus sp. m RMFG-2023]
MSENNSNKKRELSEGCVYHYNAGIVMMMKEKMHRQNKFNADELMLLRTRIRYSMLGWSMTEPKQTINLQGPVLDNTNSPIMNQEVL